MHEYMGVYRGKRCDNEKWVIGNLVVQQNEVLILSWEEGCRRSDTVNPHTVGEFTGKVDKNGEPIFEGDIVDMTGQWWDACGPAGHDSPICSVEWDSGICGFTPFADYDCDCGVYIEARGCKIIGNIYDNPDAMGNCITVEDTNGNRKLLKKRYEEKIDAVAALLNKKE